VLQGAGTISHAQAIEKATEEYRKYQVQNLSPVEEEYLESIKNIHSTVKKNSKN
jgi:Virulence protein